MGDDIMQQLLATGDVLGGCMEGGAMKAFPGVLQGTVVFEPSRRRDEGDFSTIIFDAEVVRAVGLDTRNLVQESQTRIPRGGVFGLDLRMDGGEGKLVRCAAGAVAHVSVDLRPSSPTYRQWMSIVLDDIDHRSVWLAPGLAHGYQGLTETADVCCRVDRVHRPEYEVTIRYDDPDLGIPWPLHVTTSTSADDGTPTLAVVEPMLSEWFGLLPCDTW